MGTWIDQELAGCEFADERLGKRFGMLMEQFSKDIGRTIPLACGDWAATKAAYRFLDNDRVCEAEILAGHFQATRERFAAVEGPVLVLHDTTEFSFTREDTHAIGLTKKVAKGHKDERGRQRMHTVCGILMHSSLVVTTDGLPLGLAAIKLWTRKKFKGTNALQGKGIEDIVELEYTGQTVSTREFQGFRLGGANKAESDILIPQIRYATNDAWEIVSALTSATKTSGTPILLSAKYSKGQLYVLTIPQAMGDLYSYPQGVWKAIRDVLTRDMYVHLDAPTRVSLFVYDNDRFIAESFQESPVEARIVTDKRSTRLRDVLSGAELKGEPQGATTVFTMQLERASYRVFAGLAN